ncbi:wax ester/triacylglycerol synthase domain-containing protein [Saccharopolyspora sp. NPDC050389]|uniref:wax ester/triacylglycerol synthase domain-containing protein n=1 Tax=Saccharopolyspora sp. NPDC050389 TaxID=3155516 RepID=UPI0033E3928E
MDNFLSATEELLADGVEPAGVAAIFSGEPPDITVLRERVAERWGPFSRLRWMLPTEESRLRRRRWTVLDRFDPRQQVVVGDDVELEALLGDLMIQPLVGDVPPWRLHLVRQPSRDGFALVLIAHHAVLDMESSKILFSHLLDGPKPRARTRTGATPESSSVRQTAMSTLRNVLVGGRSLPVADVDTEPELACASVDARQLRAVRSALPGEGVTPTEVLLAGAAGAVRSVFGRPNDWPGKPGELYAVVPKNRRTWQNAQELGNVLSGVRIQLPAAADRPEDRLAACRGALTSGRADSVDGAARLLDAALRLGPWALRAATTLLTSPNFASVQCTALRWAPGAWAFGGAPLRRVVAMPDIPAPGTISFSLVGYADALSLSVVSNTVPGHARMLADAVTREIALLADLAEPAAARSEPDS